MSVVLLALVLGLVVGGVAVAFISGQTTGGRTSSGSLTQAQETGDTTTVGALSTSTTFLGASTSSANRTISVAIALNTAAMHLQASQLLYSGGSTVTVFGTLNPPPPLSTGVQVTTRNPQGVVVDIGEALIGTTTGTFLYSLPSGGSAGWIQGAYSVNATGDSGSATTIFYYNPSQATPNGTRLNLQVLAPSLTSPGQQVSVAALLPSRMGRSTTLPHGRSSRSCTLTGRCMTSAQREPHPATAHFRGSTRGSIR